jgi:hypothetical protein
MHGGCNLNKKKKMKLKNLYKGLLATSALCLCFEANASDTSLFQTVEGVAAYQNTTAAGAAEFFDDISNGRTLDQVNVALGEDLDELKTMLGVNPDFPVAAGGEVGGTSLENDIDAIAAELAPNAQSLAAALASIEADETGTEAQYVVANTALIAADAAFGGPVNPGNTAKELLRAQITAFYNLFANNNVGVVDITTFNKIGTAEPMTAANSTIADLLNFLANAPAYH